MDWYMHAAHALLLTHKEYGYNSEDAPVEAMHCSKGRVKSMIGQAEKEMRDGEYKDAVRTLNSAKGLDPKNIEIYKLLEQAYSRSGDRESAREAANTRRELERAP